MAVFENFPYTDFHNLNLDWILEIVKTIDSTVAEKEDVGKLTYNGMKFPFTVEPLTLTDGAGQVTTYNIIVAEV